MPRFGAPTKKVIPADVTWITFNRSDAVPDRWPTNTINNTDETGFMNYMKPLHIDDEKATNWRITIGNDIARLLEYPRGNYAIQQWPDGYQLYDHLKGAPPSIRSDLYLMGSIFVGKFRSAAEFTPHAVWLLSDATMDRGNCGCKYCAKIPQRMVSDHMGLNQKGDARPLKKSTRVRVTRSQQKVHATVRKAPKKWTPLDPPKHFSVPERERDLRAAISSKGMKIKRWAREGEMVWCALDPPIINDPSTPLHEGIILWPGLVKEIRLKPQIKSTRPQASEDVDMADESGSTYATKQSNGQTSTDLGIEDTEEDPPFTVSHSVVYKVKLLAVQSECLVPDDQLLPYQAYAPPSKLLTLCGNVQISLNGFQFTHTDPKINQEACMEHLARGFSEFQPILTEEAKLGLVGYAVQDRFRQAVGPFALAIQQAAHIAGFWTPTDVFDFKMATPKEGAFADATNTQQPAQNDIRILEKSKEKDKYYWQTQTRFQGLWWGAERIWMEEMVRLKIDRAHLASENQQSMFRLPAVNGPRRQEFLAERQASLKGDFHGPGSRGVFMFIEGLFLAEVLLPGGGQRRECRVSGKLYELADEDSIDQDAPFESAHGSPTLDGGKGKAKEPVQEPIPNHPAITLQTLLESVNPSAIDTSQTGPSTSTSQPEVTSTTTAAQVSVTNDQTTQVSVTQVATRSTLQTSDTSNVVAGLNDMSTPSDKYPLPQPPAGYRFRPVLLPGHEAVLDVSCVSGRYYPAILSSPLISHPLVRDLVSSTHADKYKLWNLEEAITLGRIIRREQAKANPDQMPIDLTGHETVIAMPDGTTIPISNINADALWSLEGLCAGVANAVDPYKWKPSRVGMAKEADATAKSEMYDFWSNTNAFVIDVDHDMPATSSLFQ